MKRYDYALLAILVDTQSVVGMWQEPVNAPSGKGKEPYPLSSPLICACNLQILRCSRHFCAIDDGTP